MKEDDTMKTPVTSGVRLARRIEGKDKVPYVEMAEDGVNIPLSGGGSLQVNRDNIDALSKAIGMFSPEDVKRILEALEDRLEKREEERIEEETREKSDTNPDFSDIPEEIFRKLF